LKARRGGDKKRNNREDREGESNKGIEKKKGDVYMDIWSWM